MDQHRGVTVVRTRAEFDRWLAHAVLGRSNRHQLWLGRPGKGKTARIHLHVKNTVGSDVFPDREGRVEAPIYSGRITPAKWFVRGWQHHLEPLVCFNDVSIRRRDEAWEAMLCQFLETCGPRTVRWDLKARAALDPEDEREIARYLKCKGLLAAFEDEQRKRAALEDDESEFLDLLEPASFPQSLPGLATHEHAFRSRGGAEDPVPDSFRRPARERLILPSSYETVSTMILIANDLGGEGWERTYSRLRVFRWEPLVDEQIEELKSWNPPLLGAILGVIEASHGQGEVLNLDYRAVLDANEALRLGMPWEDALRDSFFSPGDVQVQVDADAVLDWLLQKRAGPGAKLTERDLYQEVGSLRGDKNKARRSVALDYLAAQGWIERFQPPRALRPGIPGRRPGMMFRVLRLPKD
jgi:hypothetical protein